MSERHPLRYWLQVDDEVVAVREIEGREAMSAPFRFEVRFARGGGLWAEPEELLKRPALIRMERDGERVRDVAGVVTEIAAEARIRGATEVYAVIEPQLALLCHRTDHRVFRDKSVPEIVEEVLRVVGIARDAAGAPSRLTLRLSGSYAKRAYTVQCLESDLDFVHRLLEDEGIHYYFLEEDGLVLGDSPAAYEPIRGPQIIPFRAGHGMDMNEDAINAIGRRAAASVGKVSLRDLDLDRPSLDLSASAEGPTPGGPELYDYPGEYADPAEGARKVRRIAEAHACAAATFSGKSLSGRLVPGHVFELEETPEAVAEGRHLVTAVRHAWRRDVTGFSCGFDSLPAEMTYRPPIETPEPRLLNPVSGIVTGPAGEDIHTDAAGRVKVHFHWDRLQPYDDDCSDWIPVIQDNTGRSVAIPRIGWEVLVHFLEGDPDRPVVLGRLYNAADNFPNPLPADKTKSALKSLSSPGRNGTNQIELDDRAGSEKITVLAERDQNIRVAHDKDTTIEHDQQVVVTRDETVDVGHDQTEEVGNDFVHGIERNQTRTVEGSRTRKVGGSETSTVAKDRSVTIGGVHMRRIGTDDVVTANDLVEKVSAVNLEAFVKTNTTSSSKTGRITVGGALVELVKDQKSESATARAETVGGLFFTKTGKGQFSAVQKSRVITVGGAKSITAQEGVTIAAGKSVSLSAKVGSFSADDIMLKVGGSFIQIKDGTVAVNAAKTLTLAISGKNTLTAGGIAIIPASVGSLEAADGGYAADAGGASGSAHTGDSAVGVKAAYDPSGPIAGPPPKGAPNPAKADAVAGMARYLFERGLLDEEQHAAVTDPGLTLDQQIALMKSFVDGRQSVIASEPLTWDQVLAQREKELREQYGDGRMRDVGWFDDWWSGRRSGGEPPELLQQADWGLMLRPSEEQVQEMLTTAKIVAVSGHASGQNLGYFTEQHMLKMSPTPTLLFIVSGCNSASKRGMTRQTMLGEAFLRNNQDPESAAFVGFSGELSYGTESAALDDMVKYMQQHPDAPLSEVVRVENNKPRYPLTNPVAMNKGAWVVMGNKDLTYAEIRKQLEAEGKK